MSDITTEQKLQLVQQVRSRYNENQYDMSNRERVLYGKTSIPLQAAGYGEEPQSGEPYVSSFKLRLLLALLLFGAVVFMDVRHIKIGAFTTEKLYGMIAADYEEKLEEWVETLSDSVYREP